MNPDFNADIQEEDAILLETLISSPVFGAMKRLLDSYRKTCFSQLLTVNETNQIFKLQGIILGVNAIENLPGNLVARRRAKMNKVEPKPVQMPKKE